MRLLKVLSVTSVVLAAINVLARSCGRASEAKHGHNDATNQTRAPAKDYLGTHAGSEGLVAEPVCQVELASRESTVGLGPQAVALADVNGDHKLDLAVVDACIPVTDRCVNETVDVFLGNGDGTFKAAKSSVSLQSDVTFIEFGDLDGDSKPDLVTVDPSAELASVMLGTGDGRFHPLGSYETEGRASGLAVLADANSDGRPTLPWLTPVNKVSKIPA